MASNQNKAAGLTLCLDVGNSNLYAGVYDKNQNILLRFRKTSHGGSSADEYGVFLKSVLRENNIDPLQVDSIGICSVVPDAIYSIRRACIKYFASEPFLLQAGVKTGLHIMYRNPQDVGADRIANAVAVGVRFPNINCIVVDFGTATTFDTISASKKYLGGAILPGLRISMEALEERTARLPSVEIVAADLACGRTTIESIQAGLFFGHMGMIKEISSRISQECFSGEKVLLIATGGFASLFADSGLFDHILPDLVLEGLYHTMQINKSELIQLKGVKQ